MKTNSKEVIQAIELHLLEIKLEDMSNDIETLKKEIGDTYKSEVGNHWNGNIQEGFAYWLGGLALHTHYTQDDIVNFLHSIGLHGKNQKQEEEKATELYHYLIFKAVKKYIY